MRYFIVFEEWKSLDYCYYTNIRRYNTKQELKDCIARIDEMGRDFGNIIMIGKLDKEYERETSTKLLEKKL